MSEKKYVTENIRPDYREEYLRNSVFIAYAVLYIIWFFNLLTLSVPDVTPGCFLIFWLWAFLTVLQDVFQSFDLERTWRYSSMFFQKSIPRLYYCITTYQTNVPRYISYSFCASDEACHCFIDTWSSICDSSLQWMNKSNPCFCECEDAKADCIKRTVPALEIPLDDLIGKIRTDFCDMHMLTCMKNCIHWI